MKDIQDFRHEYQLTKELGYRSLSIQDIKSSYRPCFMIHHRKEKTLSYAQVIDYKAVDNYLVNVTLQYADGSSEVLNSFALEVRLFKQV